MKFVFIYGPPAVGKLTVATQLSRITGFRLHHNHLSVDFVKSIFEFGTPTFRKLVDKYRRDLIKEAVSADIDTIFTYVYEKGKDDDFVVDLRRKVLSQASTFCPVRLHCSCKVLRMRVANRSRRRMGKLTSSSELNVWFRKYRLDFAIPGSESLSLDTGKLTPKAAAEEIVRHFSLDKGRRLASESRGNRPRREGGRHEQSS